MGRAEYGEGFSFGQNCTVGNNKGIYPVLGENVRMCANSSIIGNCRIGDNVIIGANSGVKDEGCAGQFNCFRVFSPFNYKG